MTTGVLLTPPICQFFGNNGLPAVNGTVLTQVGGVNTATYQDSGLTTPLPNPIPLNSRGEVSTSNGVSSQCFLTPNTVYTFTLFDAAGNQLWVATYVNGVQLSLTQATVGAALYPTTAAETTASVTPSNFAYPSLNVLRYGATGNGVTDDSGAFNNMFKVAAVAGGDCIIPQPSNFYLVTSVLNCTNASTGAAYNVRMQPNLHFSANGPANICAQHTGVAVFDCTGNNGICFYDVCITTGSNVSTPNWPKTAFLCARNNSGASIIQRFNNCRVYGYFSVAVYYNYGSEDDILHGCYFQNNSPQTNTFNTGSNNDAPKVVVYSANNIVGLTSPYVTIYSGVISTIHHQIFGGDFGNNGGQSTCDVFYYDDAAEIVMIGVWMSNANGRAYHYVNGATGFANYVRLYGCEGENTSSGPLYGILFSNTAATATNWSVIDQYWKIQTFSISAPFATTVLDNFYVSNLQEQTNRGIYVPDQLQNSTINYNGTIQIGTSFRNVLIGNFASMTITTRSSDMILDQVTGQIMTRQGIGIWGNSPAGQQTGWGTPTGGAAVSNYPGATATLGQTSQALAAVIGQLKALGLLGA